ncbi:hypothetical protein M728_005383 (plasmid) [Ensifer sp. WSM1721]|uniref:hypothetical protein n=1 Tax=Ensifer sp. WSM1721 TaxID=1041159 RepID=UPI0012EBF7D7|nr:hypothetical protein [Ensifer sp. WSM1721]
MPTPHALGKPLRLLTGPASKAVSNALEMIEAVACAMSPANLGQDADYFHDSILDQRAIPVIQPMLGRNHHRAFDEEL